MTTLNKPRTEFLGASEIAAVLGMADDHDTAYTVWARKTGQAPEKESTPMMRRGNKIEELALQDFCERTGKPRDGLDTQLFLVHPDYPYLAATLDVWDGMEDAAWEFKSTGHWAAKEWDSQTSPKKFPQRHALQNTYQRAVALAFYKLEYVGGGLVHFPMETLEGEDFPLPYEADLGGMLIEAGARFWTDHVLTGIPPRIEGTTAEAEMFKKRFAQAEPGKVVVATPEIEQLVKDALDNILQVEIAEEKLTAKKLMIQAFMDDAERLVLSDGRELVWKNSKGSVSWKGVAGELGPTPELIAKHTPAVGARPFNLKALLEGQE